jgi:wobble nucleotide-excising tRNase
MPEPLGGAEGAAPTMIDKFQLIRNIGRFDSFSAPSDAEFSRLTLVYGENGRGKSTLSAILRSLSTGDPIFINERRRLGAANPPHVVIPIDNGQRTAVFESSRWSFLLPDILIFDDVFIDQNVHSGLQVAPNHRQNLHELILGRPGVALARRVEDLTRQITDLQSIVREKEARLTPEIRRNMPIDEFCALPELPDIDVAIEAAQRRITALEQADGVRSTGSFEPFALPPIEIPELEALLARGIDGLDAAALAAVRSHFGSLDHAGESWISQGIGYLPQEGSPGGCPFCGQDLCGSRLVDHYRAYFGREYTQHKAAVTGTRSTLSAQLSGDTLARFQRDLEAARQGHRFWRQFLDIPEIDLDSERLARVWQQARETSLELLDRKIASPLEEIRLEENSRVGLSRYLEAAALVLGASRSLQGHNEAILRLKAETAEGNLPAARADRERLVATQARHSIDLDRLCADYLTAKQQIEEKEGLKAEAREQLDRHRTAVIPRYQSAINELLRKFNTDFRIVQVQAVNPRGVPSSTYCLEINTQLVPVSGTEPPPGEPAFKSTLSSGDRNTLALAFFFAWLEHEADLSLAVIVIDDPVSSLDDSRALATAQEIRALICRTRQTIVLSHSKALLCAIWQHADQSLSRALEVRRSPAGSVVSTWNIHEAAVTEYDRRHSLLRDYARGTVQDARQAAQSLRPALEGFLRVACPEHCPPGTLLRDFVNRARQSLTGPSPVLASADLQELEQIKEYANRFHHDPNPAWDVEVANINETQLLGFVQRVLAFTRRRVASAIA